MGHTAIRIVLTAAALAISACATSTEPKSGLVGEIVTWENEVAPFCGRCDNLKLQIASDGRVWIEQGHWAGHYRDWRVHRSFAKITPERVSAFRAAIDPFRPAGLRSLDGQSCKNLWSDMPGVWVSWKTGSATDELRANFGCVPEVSAEMAAALSRAPDLLQVPGLQAPSPTWVATTLR
jgi:hypothetical protein